MPLVGVTVIIIYNNEVKKAFLTNNLYFLFYFLIGLQNYTIPKKKNKVFRVIIQKFNNNT